MFQINEGDLLTEKSDRYLRYSVWAQLAAFVACIYLLYRYYLAPSETGMPLQYLSARILLGMIGAAAAIGATFLSKAMWMYWKNYDNSSNRSRRLWFFLLSFPPLFGSVAYYFLVYQAQAKERKSEK